MDKRFFDSEISFIQLVKMAHRLVLLSILFGTYLNSVQCSTTINSSSQVSPFLTYLCDDDLLKSTANKVDLVNLKLENNNLRLQHDLITMKEDLLREISSRLELFELNISTKINQHCKTSQKYQTDTVESKKPANCAEAMLRDDGTMGSSGIYQLHLPDSIRKPFFAYCLQDPHGGDPWIIIQRRQSNTTDFYRGWYEYERGFGNLESDFFLGLDKIHALTQTQLNELWISLENFDNQTRYAKYDSFAIGNSQQKYSLDVLGKYTGTAGDSLTAHQGEKFTTKDSDNDKWTENCAIQYTGAWWYGKCHTSNLNGLYLGGEFPKDQYAKGIVWYHWLGHYYSLKYVHMAIRPRK